MATVEEVKMKARLRRWHVYHVKVATGKTDKELGKQFGVSPSQINKLCRWVKLDVENRNITEERKQRRFERDIRQLIPIIEQIKELAKDGKD